METGQMGCSYPAEAGLGELRVGDSTPVVVLGLPSEGDGERGSHRWHRCDRSWTTGWSFVGYARRVDLKSESKEELWRVLWGGMTQRTFKPGEEGYRQMPHVNMLTPHSHVFQPVRDGRSCKRSVPRARSGLHGSACYLEALVMDLRNESTLVQFCFLPVRGTPASPTWRSCGWSARSFTGTTHVPPHRRQGSMGGTTFFFLSSLDWFTNPLSTRYPGEERLIWLMR